MAGVREARRIVVLLVLSALLLTGMAVAQVTSSNGKPLTPRAITGQVRTQDSASGPAGILIVLTRGDGMDVSSTMTDSRGRFRFTDLTPEQYVVIVHEIDYREVRQQLDLRYSPSGFANLMLTPVHSTATPTSTAPANGFISAKLPTDDTARKEFTKAMELISAPNSDGAAILPHLEKVRSVEPAFQPTYVLMGRAYMDQHNWKDAETALKKAGELDPKDYSAAFILGVCLNQERNFKGAETTLLRSIEINPSAAEGRYELARSYLALNDFKSAETQLVEVERMAPTFAPAHVAMGNVLLRKHDKQGALREFKQSLVLDPKSPMAEPTRQVIGRLEKEDVAAQQ